MSEKCEHCNSEMFFRGITIHCPVCDKEALKQMELDEEEDALWQDEDDDEFDIPHEASKVKCDLCAHEWIAVRPEGLTKLECPNCSNMVNFENIHNLND